MKGAADKVADNMLYMSLAIMLIIFVCSVVYDRMVIMEAASQLQAELELKP